ncbi:putative membrane protein, O antigen ligase family [Campylobacter iguaniorum]|uniref:O-antigen ligase family protein n=1 Tax=Campylobacter iguaniorum TaxID=1244531 RepID=UPI0007C9B2CE|nr:O-antigen ligase family protein [Campylobacter iguaniorum]ANE36355.1 putative membrane protein, O antigen ligase family [Campylobacter iguaniorum]
MRQKAMQYFKEQNPQILIFKFFLFIWIMSIPFKNSIYQISFVILNLFFITHLLYTKNFNSIKDILYKTRFLTIAFIGIFLSMIISNLLNLQYISTKSWSYIFLFIFRYGTIFLALAYFYKLEYFSKKEIIYFIFSGLILLALTSIFYIIKDPEMTRGLSGSLGSRTGFGLFMGLGLVLSFIVIKHKILMPALTIFFIFFTIFSFARSSWVASTVAIAAFILLNLKTIRKKDILFLITLSALILILYFGFESFQQRFATLMEGNSTHRFFIWSYCVDMIMQNPIFGYGMDVFRNLPNSPALLSPDWNSTHNMILESLLYTGLFGAIFCFWLVSITFFKTLKTKNYQLFAIFTYIFVVSQFDFGAYMSKELLSFIVIFTFLAYSSNFKESA